MNCCIFISINEEFLALLKVCLKSIVKNYPGHPDIIICYTDLAKEHMQDLNNITKCIFIKNELAAEDIGPIMSHLPTNTDPRVFYARFLIRKSNIFRKYDSILHLDADTLVQKPLDQLFRSQTFLITEEYYQGDDAIFSNRTSKGLVSMLDEDAITLSKVSANAGIFIVPKKYNDREVYEEFVQILKRYKEFIKRADQSIINIRLLKHKIKPDDSFLYNFQYRRLEQDNFNRKLLNSYIIHFNGIPLKTRLLAMKTGLYLLNTILGIQLHKLLYNILLRTGKKW